LQAKKAKGGNGWAWDKPGFEKEDRGTSNKRRGEMQGFFALLENDWVGVRTSRSKGKKRDNVTLERRSWFGVVGSALSSLT
jgi:hypothetical protein